MNPIHFKLDSKPALWVHDWNPALVAAKSILLCVQGLGGHGAYYEFLTSICAHHSIRLFSFDLRGHGHSEGVRGDLEDFQDYVDDLDTVLQEIKRRAPQTPIHMLGESMGASIAIQGLTRKKWDMASLVLVTPVLQPVMRFKFSDVLTFIKGLILDTKKPILSLRGHEEKGCRDHAFNQFLRADQLFVPYASVRFMMGLNTFMGQALKQFAGLKLPILILQSGQDQVTHYSKLLQSFDQLPQKKEWKKVSEAYHCLFHDPCTDEALKSLMEWLE